MKMIGKLLACVLLSGLLFLIMTTTASKLWPTTELLAIREQKKLQEAWDEKNDDMNSSSNHGFIVRNEQYLANQRPAIRVDKIAIYLKDYYHLPGHESLSSKEKAKWAREQVLAQAQRGDLDYRSCSDYCNVVCYPEFGCAFTGRLSGLNGLDHLTNLLEGKDYPVIDLGSRPIVAKLSGPAYVAPWYWNYLRFGVTISPTIIFGAIAAIRKLVRFLNERRKLREQAKKELDQILSEHPAPLASYREHICSACGQTTKK